ncbi:MAG: hypothetical protein RSA29_02515 [Clostridium sp.]|uniref:hypothetical protein n=1 Tax=Clostridium sp. TaxID=1506 RepID=UPI0030594DB4
MKVKTMKLSDYFEVRKQQYIFIKITPHKSIRNYTSNNIAKAIAHTYKAINKRIKREQNKFVIETSFKISYIIDIENNNANFYFLVPRFFTNIILEKIREIWSKATIELLEDGIKEFGENAEMYSLGYKKEDAMSLLVDRKSNEPLNSILNVMEIMKDKDRVTIIYNFIPTTQYPWINQYNSTLKKITEKKSIDKKVLSVDYIVRNGVVTILNILDSLMNVVADFLGGKAKDSKESLYTSILGVLEQQNELSAATKRKKESNIIKTQIAVISESEDTIRKENNAISICQSYRSIDDNNELIYKKVKKVPAVTDYDFNIDTNIMSSEELGNFIQIPGRSLLTQFGIKHIQIEENMVAKELQQGYMCLGQNSYKGNNINAYLQDNYDVGSYPLSINGSQGAGKSTFMANIYRFARTRGEGGVLIDYIKNNELAEEVLKYVDKKDVIVLDYSNEKCMQGFAFNESTNLNLTTPFKRIKNANLQVMQFVELINAINDEAQPLQARMRKYLIAAGTIVFCVGETSLKAIIDCLEDYKKRAEYISRLDKELIPLLEDKIKMICELDEHSKATKENPISEVIGNKDARIDGILDRVSLLKEDIALEYMFNKGSNDNIDFSKELEKGKLIIIKMLQDEWSNQAKDIITTFFISKIWMATEIRGKWNKQPKRTYISIDEIFQCPTAMQMLSKKNILPQTRKFGCKFVFSTQGLPQLKNLLISIVDAGGTFMLLKGTKEEDFNLLKNKFENYEYEDLRDMAKTYDYPSLNLVYYSKGYSSFITRLPKPMIRV